MLTVFSNPRPFHGQFDVIQRNAINSWLHLRPKIEVVLIDDEERTTQKVAAELGIRCVTGVVCNEFGTPLIHDVFNRIQQLASYDILAQVNTDIILMGDFTQAVQAVQRVLEERQFLMVGRRWDLGMTGEIQYDETGVWEQKLREQLRAGGRLHGMSGMDYWVFRRDLLLCPPPFVVGRPGIDGWLLYRTRSLGIPVIDATAMVTIVHQNHGYPLAALPSFEIEQDRNRKLAGWSASFSLRDADWLLSEQGLRRTGFPRRVYVMLSMLPPWRLTLAIKRRVQRLTASWRRKRRRYNKV